MKKETSVPGESDRDRTVERLLETRAFDASMDATPECVDAETLAVWMDGGLPASAAARVESHLSTCARCQATMALFARVEPAAAATIPFWRRQWFGWLVPIATAAAAVTIWVALPSHQDFATNTTNAPASTIARNELPGPTQAPGAPPISRRFDAPINKDARERQEITTQESQRAAAPKKAEAAPATAAKTMAAPAELKPTPAPVAAPPAPPPAAATATPIPATPPPLQPPITTQNRLNTVAVPPPTAAAGAATGAAVGQGLGQAQPARDANRSSTIDGLPQGQIAITVAVVEIVSADPSLGAGRAAAIGGGGGGRAGAGGGRGGGGNVRALPAPPPPPPAAFRARWRILNGTKVERSVDDGKTWNPIAIDPPAAILIAGSAPSPAVCWLVGRDGVVMLAVDGVHFVRVISPGPIDFVSVRATSARDASVTAVDGRVFVTSDGGVTWTTGR